MRNHVRTGAWGALAILLAASAAWGADFSYFEDFNDYGNMPSNGTGPEPIGWISWDNGYWSVQESKPRIFAGDYGGWNTDYAGNDDDFWHSYWGTLGSVNYAVPWSGGARYNLIHSGWDPNYRNADAWYSGEPQPGYTAKHTGTYPMDLTNSKMRAEFDVSLRSGVRATILNGGTCSGGLFAVQPATNAADILLGGPNGGWLGWGATGGLPGFSVELDVQPSGGDPAAGTDGNHIGINAMVQWRDRAGLSSVPSIASNLDAPYGAPLPFNMELVGDNNQPLHLTVYYNDPVESPDGVSLGWVRVYLKVRAADKAAGDPAVPTGQAPYSFGEGPTDPADGILVAQAYVGAFPSNAAVFGFCAANEWYKLNEIFQVDNVKVETRTVSGTATTTPSWAPAFNADPQGRAVTVDPAGKVADNTTNLSVPGWTCYTYPGICDYWNPGEGLMAWFKGGIATSDALGMGGPGVVERMINWVEQRDGQDDQIAYSHEWPGMPYYDNQWYCVLAKGYIYFPVAGTFSLCAPVDDGSELVIGNQQILAGSGWGYGLESGIIANVTVTTPGVYPIQLIAYEGYGGSNAEFFRRTGNPLVPFVPIGVSNYGFADQPVVFSKLNGNLPATNLAATDAVGALVYPVAQATLDTSSRMGDVSTASGSGVTVKKVVNAPNRWYWDGGGNVLPDFTYSIDQWQRTNEVNWLNFLENKVSGTGTVPTINFMGQNYWTECHPGSEFPGWVGGVRAIGARFEGYIVFPEAGTYWLGVVSEDGSYLYIGSQMIFETMSFDEPGKLVQLTVPQAGVYPLRVEFAASVDSRILTLYEVVPGHSKVVVNDTLSRIKLATGCTAGTYTWPATFNRQPVVPPADDPANHKVANVGQGGTPGWNGTVTRFTDSGVDIWYTAQVAMWLKGNDPKCIAYPAPHSLSSLDGTFTQTTAVVPDINFWTQFDLTDFVCCEGMPAGFLPWFNTTMRYFGDYFSNISVDPGVNEDRFAATFTGYVEFTQPGYYVFNAGTSDGMNIWVGGVTVTSKSWTNGWPYESNPGFFYVAQPGIYDIRVDYFQQYWNSLVNVFMWLPNGNRVLLNSPEAQAAGVTVYASLAAGVEPATTYFADPTVVPASDKAATLNAGGVPGYHVMVAHANMNGSPVPWRGYGYELITNIFTAEDYLATLVDGVPSRASLIGAVADYVTGPTEPLFICPDCGPPGGQQWAGGQRDNVAARVNGYMALKAGGHMLSICTDDGSRLVIGGHFVSPETVPVNATSDTVQTYKKLVGGKEISRLKLGNVGTRHQDEYYVYVEEDGIYPFEVTYNNGWGGTALVIRETPDPLVNDGNVMEANYQYPNYGTIGAPNTETFTKVYVTLCNTPWADADGDKDVDQADFGIFQACFTGTQTGTLSVQCKCLDKAGNDNMISADDYMAFMNCWTGSTIQATACP